MDKRLSVLLLVVGCCLGLVTGRYMAIPVEDVLDMGELTRLRSPREVEAVGTVRGARGATEDKSAEREEGYVDFGAHSGSRGAYGWYADFPAQS